MKRIAALSAAVAIVLLFCVEAKAGGPSISYDEWSKPIPADRRAALEKQYPDIQWDLAPSGGIADTIKAYNLLTITCTRTGKKLLKVLKVHRNLQIVNKPVNKNLRFIDISPEWPVERQSAIAMFFLDAESDPVFDVNLKTGAVTAKNAFAGAYLDN